MMSCHLFDESVHMPSENRYIKISPSALQLHAHPRRRVFGLPQKGWCSRAEEPTASPRKQSMLNSPGVKCILSPSQQGLGCRECCLFIFKQQPQKATYKLLKPLWGINRKLMNVLWIDHFASAQIPNLLQGLLWGSATRGLTWGTQKAGPLKPEQTPAQGSLCPLKCLSEALPHSHLNKHKTHMGTEKMPQFTFSKHLSLLPAAHRWGRRTCLCFPGGTRSHPRK